MPTSQRRGLPVCVQVYLKAPLSNSRATHGRRLAGPDQDLGLAAGPLYRDDRNLASQVIDLLNWAGQCQV
ncbi:MAG TPA: hypothetical protein VN969_02115 [Streptosporangiaceae bacterium]|nr:hypothetical protein [Streptosporangiaceae bacterium]